MAGGSLDIWVRYKTVSPSSTLECSSRKYPGSPILATACDGVIECLNNEDESLCQNQLISKYLLAGSIIMLLLVYLVMKYTKTTKKTKYTPPSTKIMSIEKVLEDFEKHRDNQGTLTNVIAARKQNLDISWIT